MAIKATSQISIADLNDSKVLSGYLTSNLPKVQIFNPNTNSYTPSWTGSGELKITPIAFLNQTVISNTDPGITILWKKREGNDTEKNLDSTGETINAGTLTISQNKLAAVTSGVLSYICRITYTDPDLGVASNVELVISYSLVRHAINAKLVDITGEQVFKYDKDSVVSPLQINLNAALTNVTVTSWQYKNGSNVWVSYPTGADNPTLTTSGLVVKPGHAVFFNDAAQIKIKTSDVNVEDIITIYKVKDGALGIPGQDAYTTILTVEAITIPTTSAGVTTSAMSVQCNVIAYKGATKVTPAIGTITGQVSGMTVDLGTVSNNEQRLGINIAKTSSLGGSDTGEIKIPIIIDGKTFEKVISWSKSKTGDIGPSGQNAVVFQLITPKGQVFLNQEGSLTIEAVAYDGSTVVSSGATYKWYQYSSGTWSLMSGKTSKTLTILGSDVANIGSYKAVMTYKSKTYEDIVTLEDKSDSMLATIISTGGDVFKNTIGTSELIAKLFRNGKEVDTLKSTSVGVTPPASPSSGTYWYKLNTSNKTVTLQKYTGTSWVVASGADLHQFVYKWYRRDKDGNPMDAGAMFKEGKIIYVDGDDVDLKTTFICEVE